MLKKGQNGGRSPQRVPARFNGADFSLLREVDGSFQVFWWTDLEVGLERTQAWSCWPYIYRIL